MDSVPFIARRIRSAKVIQGTVTFGRTLAALDRLPLEPDEKARIRFGNAQALFGLK